MRIGIIRTRYTPFGGAEVFLKRFMDELVRRGHTIDIFAEDWEMKKGVTLHRVKASGPSFLRPLFFSRKAERAVSRVKLDIIISLERTACQDIYRAGDGVHREWLLQRKKTASWLKRLSIALNPLHMVILYLEKRLFKSERLKMVVANSQRVKEEIIAHYGLPAEKICVIYNGIKIDHFPYVSEADRKRVRGSLRLSEDDVLVLFIGSGFERKGLLYLIRAIKLLKDTGKKVKLLVVGKGRQYAYSKEARRLGVEGSVVFAGPAKSVLPYLAAGDVFCLPSIYDPFSNACLEAMAAGLPVITSRANGANEIIIEPKNGAVVEEPSRPSEIAEKITLFLDRGRRREAGRLAMYEAAEHPIEKNVNDFLALIEGIKKPVDGSRASHGEEG